MIASFHSENIQRVDMVKHMLYIVYRRLEGDSLPHGTAFRSFGLVPTPVTSSKRFMASYRESGKFLAISLNKRRHQIAQSKVLYLKVMNCASQSQGSRRIIVFCGFKLR